jgi:hypothetical protein
MHVFSEITAPLYVNFLYTMFLIFFLISDFNSGTQILDFTGHCVWSHDAGPIMQQISHLKLMSMGFLQASGFLLLCNDYIIKTFFFWQMCGFFTEQMPYDVTIDTNKFFGAFSIFL